MDTSKLSLISCHICGKKFQTGDEVCSIVARRFNGDSVSFDDLSIEDSKSTPGHKLYLDREINFHQGCFEAVAGDEYIP